MHGLHYRAIDEQGRIHIGFTTSRNQLELNQWIAQRGWQALPVSASQRIRNVLGIGPRYPRWSKSEAAVFSLHLSQLLSAGVPLISALEELAKMESNKSVSAALADMTRRIDHGDALSVAMAACPGLFGNDYVAAVRAAEFAGQLNDCLRQQANNLHWQAELSERLKTVLAYPIFALMCLLGVFLFVLVYLVPAMLPLLSMSHSPLPTHTKWLIGLSEVVRQSGVIVLAVVSAISLLIILLMQSESTLKWRLQAIFLRGMYGRVATQFTLARYARSISVLYESGIEITDAMRISQELVRNAFLKKQLGDACRRILAGDSISKAMQLQSALPPLFVRMVAAGEQAGVLDVALRQCADQLQSTAQFSLARVERLIGPCLLCVMGGLLLWVALSVLGPIYSAVGQNGLLS